MRIFTVLILFSSCFHRAPLPADVKDRAHTRDVIEQMNHKHRMAQLASRASTEVFTMAFFQNKGKVEENGNYVALKGALKSNAFKND